MIYLYSNHLIIKPRLRMKTKLFTIFLITSFLMIGCGSDLSPASEPIPADSINLDTLPQTIDVQTAAALMHNEDVVLIDVREQWEYDEGHIPGITLIPMSELENRLDEIPTDKTVVLTCRSGNRSGRMHAFLEDQGFDNTVNMAGGILAWEEAGLEVER